MVKRSRPVPRSIPPPPRGYVWIDDAAQRLGVGKTTLYKWRYQGYGPVAVPMGRRLAYRIADIDDHLAALYTAATTAAPPDETRPPEPRPSRRVHATVSA
jgi:predicted DNA-binding transcriptional regulator AlpA